MIKLYICPKCGWIRTVSRRAEVECFRCQNEPMKQLKLDYRTYTKMSDAERKDYVDSWMYIHDIKGTRA